MLLAFSALQGDAKISAPGTLRLFQICTGWRKAQKTAAPVA
jgi:hypothetical protein